MSGQVEMQVRQNGCRFAYRDRAAAQRRPITFYAIAVTAAVFYLTCFFEARAGSYNLSNTFGKDFFNLCDAHAGDPAAVLTEAQHSGWSTLDRKKIPAFKASGLVIDWAMGAIRTSPKDSAVIVTERARFFDNYGLKSTPVAVCLIVHKPVDEETLGRVGIWAGVVPQLGPEKALTYLFTNHRGSHAGVQRVEFFDTLQSGVGRELVTQTFNQERVSVITLVTPLLVAPERTH